MNFTLTQEDYEALVALAREGTNDKEGSPLPEKSRRLDEFLRSVEKKNGVKRDAVWVQWQELDAALPPGTDFPRKWPPELRVYIEFISRKVSRADVDQMLNARAKKPTSVLVTKDPAAQLGWTPIDDFFIV